MSTCNCQPINFPFCCQRGNCPLKDRRPDQFTCQAEVDDLRAGDDLSTAKPPEIDRPTPSDLPCQHRGQVLRQEGCGCGGKPKIDVYECGVLGECTVYSSGKSLRQKDRRRVAVCVGCEAITSALRDR